MKRKSVLLTVQLNAAEYLLLWSWNTSVIYLYRAQSSIFFLFWLKCISYIFMCVCACLCAHACKFVCIYVYISIYECKYVYLNEYMHIHVCLCVHKYVCVCLSFLWNCNFFLDCWQQLEQTHKVRYTCWCILVPEKIVLWSLENCTRNGNRQKAGVSAIYTVGTA